MAGHVFDNCLAPGSTVTCIKNVALPDPKPCTPLLGPSGNSETALNERECARWFKILLEGKFPDNIPIAPSQTPLH